MSERKLIALRFHSFMALTVAEYESLYREVTAAALVDGPTTGSRILACLLRDAAYRYRELKLEAQRTKG